MQLSIKKLLPIPLKEKLLSHTSDVWNQELSFNAGEWVKIKAPSGTGKTTLIHYLYQVRHDYEGEIFYNHTAASRLTQDKLASYRQEKISIIFQDLRLFQNLTAYENIELKRLLHTSDYKSDKIYEFAEQLHIKHILQQPVSICSYGEQQRIAIARAMIQPFEILLMDEPFSHLDEENTRASAALIAEECRKRNAGFVLTDLDNDCHFAYSQHLNL